MNQSGQVHTFQVWARRVSIVGYNTGKNQSDCTNSLKCLKEYSMDQITVFM